jgi:hypothetical protein
MFWTVFRFISTSFRVSEPDFPARSGNVLSSRKDEDYQWISSRQWMRPLLAGFMLYTAVIPVMFMSASNTSRDTKHLRGRE